MGYWERKLLREMADGRIKEMKPYITILSSGGWISSIRKLLGMSAKQLGYRVGIGQSRISRLEKAEVSGDLKLSSLKRIAEALDMTFVYGFIPRTTFEDMVNSQAEKIARERMEKVNHTMRLEKQELSDINKKKSFDDLVQKILIEQPKSFWDK